MLRLLCAVILPSSSVEQLRLLSLEFFLGIARVLKLIRSPILLLLGGLLLLFMVLEAVFDILYIRIKPQRMTRYLP